MKRPYDEDNDDGHETGLSDSNTGAHSPTVSDEHNFVSNDLIPKRYDYANTNPFRSDDPDEAMGDPAALHEFKRARMDPEVRLALFKTIRCHKMFR